MSRGIGALEDRFAEFELRHRYMGNRMDTVGDVGDRLLFKPTHDYAEGR